MSRLAPGVLDDNTNRDFKLPSDTAVCYGLCEYNLNERCSLRYYLLLRQDVSPDKEHLRWRMTIYDHILIWPASTIIYFIISLTTIHT